MKCPNCGAESYDDANRCRYCGSYRADGPRRQPPAAEPVEQPQHQQPQTVIYNIFQAGPGVPGQTRQETSAKSKWVALFLCFFFGYWGFHKFYVGKTAAGILYFFTFGIFGFGWLFDLMLILSGAYTDRQGRKLA